MNIRYDVLQRTLEHVELDFNIIGNKYMARVVLDSKNLTKTEINKLRILFNLPEIEEWYPKVMREIVLFEMFLKENDINYTKNMHIFSELFRNIMDVELEKEWWENKSIRPKQNRKHAKKWASDNINKIKL